MTFLLEQIFAPLLIGFFAATVGALPFGLVNLNVVRLALLGQKRYAVKVIHGAAFIEVLYGFFAILAGSAVFVLTEGNNWVNAMVVVVLLVAGLYFFTKKPGSKVQGNNQNHGFFYGALLNLLSVQVFFYWIIALVFIHSRNVITFDIPSIMVFVFGLWLGKITTLLGYFYFSNKILSRSQFFEKNINRVIGAILLAASVLQGVKITL
ncbi:MAG: hypothetical protein K0B09_01250 [Bacteroidales bacterium]|nr:hypothetical protein [Bacteroidales bacterium]